MFKFFRIPFASSGTTTPIPDPIESSGEVSFTEGYGADYQRVKTDPLSKNIERDKMNYLFEALTQMGQDYQVWGTPEFITTAENGGTPYEYDEGARCRYLGVVYVSIKAANVDLPSVATSWQRLNVLSRGQSRVVGLIGLPNAGTPLTQYDLSADSVVLRNPTTGETFTVSPVAAITNNLSTAGPAANGRDVAGAFTASSWVHLYFIFNPATGTLATLSSAVAPTTGPTLPAGYTFWAYAGAVYWNGSSNIVNTYLRGSWATYRAQQSAVASGAATSSTSVNVAALVPPNALEMKLSIQSVQVTSSGGSFSGTATIEYVSGQTAFQAPCNGLIASSGQSMAVGGGQVIIPNIGQAFRYYMAGVSGASAATTSIAVGGYKLPNGGE